MIELANSHRAPVESHAVLHRCHPSDIVPVTVVLRRSKPAPEIGERLSREAFEAAHQADIRDWDDTWNHLTAHGITVTHTCSKSRTIRCQGTVEQLEAAFGIELHEHQAPDGSTYRAHRAPVQLPDHLADIVTGVLGLDNRPVAKPLFKRHPDRGITFHAQQAQGAFTPIQIASLYDFPASDGAGECVAIIELGGGYVQSDLTAYFNGLGVGPVAVTSVSVDGTRNTPGTDADGEVMLDIEVVGAVVPATKIAVYFAPNTDAGFLDAINQAVHDTVNKPSIISISWGGPEDQWTKSAMTAMDAALADACTLGITVTVAAGDSGSKDGEKYNTTDFPASSPHCTACGGTSLHAKNNAITLETVWDNSADEATGGGYSQVFPEPSYQFAGRKGHLRGVPDMAADADPSTGYIIRLNGQDTVIGGTSAVAPLVAGLTARINAIMGKSTGFLNTIAYANPQAFRDITVGSNGGYKASPGWDACTGLGVPIGNKLLEAIEGPA